MSKLLPKLTPAELKAVHQLSTLDRLKVWATTTTTGRTYVCISLAFDNGNPHPRWRSYMRTSTS